MYLDLYFIRFSIFENKELRWNALGSKKVWVFFGGVLISGN